MGGPSAEREVSLSSGRECATALRDAGYDVVEVDAGPDVAARLIEIAPDAVFNALHGRWGEDGAVQGILEWLQVPYTHSGILASALTLDKQRTKDVYRKVGLPVVDSILASADDVRKAHVMRPPYVVKPYNEGSSVGIYIVAEDANGPPQLADDMPAEVMNESLLSRAGLQSSKSSGAQRSWKKNHPSKANIDQKSSSRSDRRNDRPSTRYDILDDSAGQIDLPDNPV